MCAIFLILLATFRKIACVLILKSKNSREKKKKKPYHREEKRERKSSNTVVIQAYKQYKYVKRYLTVHTKEL